MQLRDIVTYLDEDLRVREIQDYPGALNGLQVANGGEVTRLAVAVDAAQATIEGAIAAGANLLLVHHGLFWDGNQPVTGRRYRRLKALLDADVAVYSAHLPLDMHPEVGNNVVLARALGIDLRGPLGAYKGQSIGVWGVLDVDRGALAARLEAVLGGPVRLIPGGPTRIRSVGVITGGAGGEIHAARDAGLDAFITGEGAHHTYFDAEEGGMNLYLGGHYATEVWGVRAMAARLEERFGLPWSFIDHPTGL